MGCTLAAQSLPWLHMGCMFWAWLHNGCIHAAKWLHSSAANKYVLAADMQPFGCIRAAIWLHVWLHTCSQMAAQCSHFLAAFFCHRLHLAALVPSTAEKAAKILAGSQPTQPVDKGICVHSNPYYVASCSPRPSFSATMTDAGTHALLKKWADAVALRTVHRGVYSPVSTRTVSWPSLENCAWSTLDTPVALVKLTHPGVA